MTGVRRSSRVPRQSAEKAEPEKSSRRSRKSLAAETPTIRETRSRSNISESRSPPSKRRVLIAEEDICNPAVPLIPPKVISGKFVDSFCWVCHRLADESMCNNCCRVYHSDCLKKLRKNSTDALCECSYTTVDGRKESRIWHPLELKEMLHYVVQEALKDVKKTTQKKQVENNKFYKLFKTWPELSRNTLLCEIVDINSIIDKINRVPPFGSTGQFFLYVKWIHHNCNIVYGPDNEITHAALQLEKNFKLELMDLEACRECYSRMHYPGYVEVDFFSKLCNPSHNIVWAKLRGSPFWPAKVLAVYENGHVDVRFFGTHDKSVLPSSQILKFSSEYPAKKKVSKAQFMDAMAEVNMYISNFEKVYGRFKYFPRNTAFDTSTVKNHKRKRSRTRETHSEDGGANENSFSGSPTKQSIFLNISFLHEDEADVKMNEVLPSTPLPSHTSINLPSFVRSNAESAVKNFSEPTSDVRCHMTCSIEAEPDHGELNTSDDFIEENSNHGSMSEDQHIALYSSSPSADAFENIESYLPVITSSCSTEESISPKVSEQASISSEEYPQNSFCELPATENPDALTAPEEDEITIVEETRGPNKIVNSVLRSTAKIDAICDLLFLNKPFFKKHLTSIMQFVKRNYLLMFLEANVNSLASNDIEGFQCIYEKCLKKIGELTNKNEGLELEVKSLKKKLAHLESQIDLRNLLRDSIVKKTIEREKNNMSQSHLEEHATFARQIKWLHQGLSEQRVQTAQALKEKEQAVKEMEQAVKEMEQVLKENAALREEINRGQDTERIGKEIICQTEKQIVPENSLTANLISSNINSNIANFNFGSFEQNKVVMEMQRSISVESAPHAWGLTGSCIDERSVSAVQQTRTSVQVPIPPTALGNMILHNPASCLLPLPTYHQHPASLSHSMASLPVTGTDRPSNRGRPYEPRNYLKRRPKRT